MSSRFLKEYRQAYIRDNLELRAKIISFIRLFFEDLNFLEVETPVRIPTPIPEANISIQDSGSWVLQSSPEICMKRLVAAGYGKIFQICKCFRKHERGTYHLPEMTMLEWYEVHSDYKKMMIQCESLLKFIAIKLECKDKIFYKGNLINFLADWDRMTVEKAFSSYSSIDLHSAMTSDRFDEIMCLEIEPKLGITRPVFLYDYPVSLGSLARISNNNCAVAERFELYCAGVELCNAFSELTNSKEQRNRFQIELERQKKTCMQTYSMPEPFLDALNDMPPTSGIAMGIDRLVMFFVNAKKIDQVVSFVPEEL